MKAFVDRGGQVIFVAPKAPGSAELLGVKWTDWTSPSENGWGSTRLAMKPDFFGSRAPSARANPSSAA